MIAPRHRRPLALVGLWLLLSLVALFFSPHPRVPVWPNGAAENNLRRVFSLPAEPTLIVFHRAGGLTPDDRAYMDAATRDLQTTHSGAQLGGATAETRVVTLPAGAADVPGLRAGLQAAPAGLSVYVTGAAAFAYDSVAAWERARLFVLMGMTALAGLVALFGRLGPRRVLVVIASVLSAGAVGSALAALVAPPSPVALATVVSAGLAGAWAVRLMSPQAGSPATAKRIPLDALTFAPEQGTVAEPEPATSAPMIRIVTPLQRALVNAGEVTLLQALVVVAGLIGLVFDFSAGAAVLAGLAAGVVVSLSETPALIALLTSPRRPASGGMALRWWVRLPLAIIPIASLILLRPTAHPADVVSRQSEAALGYALTSATGAPDAGALTPGRLLPLSVLIRTPARVDGDAEVAALEDLARDLPVQFGASSVEDAAAVQQLADAASARRANVQLMAQLEKLSAQLETDLDSQAKALASVSADLKELDKATDANRPAQGAALKDATDRLTHTSKMLTSARTDLMRMPTDFPEMAPRLRDVPTLKTLRTALETAATDLNDVNANLQRIAAQEAIAAGTTTAQAKPLAAVRADLDRSAAALQILAADAARLRTELKNAQKLQAGASSFDSNWVSQNSVRLTLMPVDDPYSRTVLDRVRTLAQAIESRLASGPLAGSEVALTGAPVAAEARRTHALQDLLIPGVVVAVLSMALLAWGALSRMSLALLAPLGAALSVAVGVGTAALVFQNLDASALALVSIVLLALVGARLATGKGSAVEELVLALPPLTLALTGVTALTVMGVVLSAGLLAGRFIVGPTLNRGSGSPAT